MSKHQSLMLKRVAGFLLALVSLSLLYLIFSNIALLGLFDAWLISLPAFLLMFLGSALMLNVGLGRSIEYWFIFIVVTSIPWGLILSRNYQILTGVILVIVTFSLFFWYRRKYKRQRAPRTYT